MTDGIGSNDIMPNPGVVLAVHVDEMRRLCNEALALQWRTWRLSEKAYWLMLCGTGAGGAVFVGAVMNQAWQRAFGMGVWTLGCAGVCAALCRFAFKGRALIDKLEKTLTTWEAAEVARRLAL